MSVTKSLILSVRSLASQRCFKEIITNDNYFLFQHTISACSTEKSKFLQEDHSSQLIYILRRQLTGSKLNKIKLSLAQKTNIPVDDDLKKGIFALARQWKCFLAGTEKGEVAFYGSSSLKRRVVGRGVLTQRDRAILLREERASRQEDAPLNLNVTSSKEPGKDAATVDIDKTVKLGLFIFCFCVVGVVARRKIRDVEVKDRFPFDQIFRKFFPNFIGEFLEVARKFVLKFHEMGITGKGCSICHEEYPQFQNESFVKQKEPRHKQKKEEREKIQEWN